jgi:benzoate-CoA ligase
VIPVCANTLLIADDYAYMLEHSRAQALVVSGPLLPVLIDAMGRASHEVRSVVVSRPAGELGPGMEDFSAWRDRAAPMAAPASTAPDAIAFWLYSSGSTGRRRGPCTRTQSSAHRGDLRARRARPARKRRHVLGSEALLRVRSR